MRILRIAAAAAFISGPASANAFDDCVLEKMPGTTSDLAARSVKVAWLRKASVQIPKDDLVGITGRAEYADFGDKIGRGFWIQLQNDTKFIITSITIDVHVGVGDNQFFETDDFWTPQIGVIYTGPPPDPTRSMQVPRFAKVDYRIISPQPGIDMKKQNFRFGISAAKGIPPQ